MLPNLPNDPACEQYLLSCAFLDGAETIAKATEAGITAETFLSPANGTIWATMLALQAKGRDPSIEHVAVELTANGGLTAIGGYPYLAEVSSSVPTTSQRSVFIDRLRELEQLRAVMVQAQRVLDAAAAYQGEGVETTFSPIVSKMAATLSGAESGPQGVAEYAEAAAKAAEAPETAVTVPSGWPAWDRVASPLRPGEMITIAARPGMGKTALAVHIANRLVYKNRRVVFYSLEMQGEELVGRMALQRAGREAVNDAKKRSAAMREVGKAQGLFVYDSRKPYGMTAIEARCRLLAQSAPLSLVIIDYLQLITPSDRRVPREQQVAEISRRCKQLAGEIGCPVMVLAQLNREVEKHDRRPILSDLRESGAIEQDSDRVWFIYQEVKDVINIESSEQTVTLFQAKCRNGPANVALKFRFDKPVFTFTPVTHMAEV
jgi:replicative DNA helicase